MTLKEWLEQNSEFEQAEMLDENGNEITYFMDNDPKYESKVLRVEAKYPEYPWVCALVFTTDRKGE